MLETLSDDATVEEDHERTEARREEVMRREEINSLFGVTDRQLDTMAEEYEHGTWKGYVGAIRPGRPRVFDEELETISFRIPKSCVKEIDRSAKAQDESRSQFLRRTINQALPV